MGTMKLRLPADPLVFGFWKVPRNICADVCYKAISAGYRRLDCACDYANEEEVGQGIAKAIADGLCTRDDLFVTSKLWYVTKTSSKHREIASTMESLTMNQRNTYHNPEHVPLALEKTLADLQLSYLDEYLIHFPISMEFVPLESKYPPEWTNMDGKMVLVNNDICATWKALELQVDKKLVKTIGLCNFSTQLIRQILSTCRIPPSTLQIELHPHNSQQKLIRFAHEAGMNVTAFSTFGASSYLELNMAAKEDVLMENPVVTRIAAAKKKSPAQVLIRWALQRNTFPLTKTANEGRMKENRDVLDFKLDEVEMKEIDGLNKNCRYNDPGAFCEPGMGTFCPIYE